MPFFPTKKADTISWDIIEMSVNGFGHNTVEVQ